MKKLFKFSILAIIIVCANYGSTIAQDEQKAFKESDKILSVGISGGGSSLGYSKLTPSISFDYGLRGTRGIMSVGGFVGYSQSNSGDDFSSYYNYGFGSQDSLYTVSKGFKYRSHTLTAGLRVGLHYATRKWDLYAGAMIGYQRIIIESSNGTTEYYKGKYTGGFSTANGTLLKTEQVEIRSFSNGKMILSPYIGARYYVTKKVALNLELGQQTGNAGLSFKF